MLFILNLKFKEMICVRHWWGSS